MLLDILTLFTDLPTHLLSPLLLFDFDSKNTGIDDPIWKMLTNGFNPRKLSEPRLTCLSGDGNILSKLIKEDRTPGTSSVLAGTYYVAITSFTKENPSDDHLFKPSTCVSGQKSK